MRDDPWNHYSTPDLPEQNAVPDDGLLLIGLAAVITLVGYVVALWALR